MELRPAYEYIGLVTNVVDGDTVDVDIDLGLDVWARDQRLRLFGIDAPEKRGATADRGKAARDYLISLLDQYGRKVVIRTQKRRDGRSKKGKYGRYVVTLFGGEDRVNLNKQMVDAGHAVNKDYS